MAAAVRDCPELADWERAALLAILERRGDEENGTEGPPRAAVRDGAKGGHASRIVPEAVDSRTDGGG